MQARLVVYRDGKQELCAPIVESGAGIGRNSGNAVQLLLPDVSKRHAFLQLTPKGWCVQDLNSRNGLFVNGKKVKDALLQDGDRLTIGPYTLVFEVAQAARPYKPILQIDVSENDEQQTMMMPQVKNFAQASTRPTSLTPARAPSSPHGV